MGIKLVKEVLWRSPWNAIVLTYQKLPAFHECFIAAYEQRGSVIKAAVCRILQDELVEMELWGFHITRWIKSGLICNSGQTAAAKALQVHFIVVLEVGVCEPNAKRPRCSVKTMVFNLDVGHQLERLAAGCISARSSRTLSNFRCAPSCTSGLFCYAMTVPVAR